MGCAQPCHDEHTVVHSTQALCPSRQHGTVWNTQQPKAVANPPRHQHKRHWACLVPRMPKLRKAKQSLPGTMRMAYNTHGNMHSARRHVFATQNAPTKVHAPPLIKHGVGTEWAVPNLATMNTQWCTAPKRCAQAANMAQCGTHNSQRLWPTPQDTNTRGTGHA